MTPTTLAELAKLRIVPPMPEYQAPDRLHPQVPIPLIKPDGWGRAGELASYRRALGLTARDVGAAMGYSVGWVSYFERGSARYPKESLEAYEAAICKVALMVFGARAEGVGVGDAAA